MRNIYKLAFLVVVIIIGLLLLCGLIDGILLRKNYTIATCKPIYWENGVKGNSGTIIIGYCYTIGKKVYWDRKSYERRLMSKEVWKHYIIGRQFNLAYSNYFSPVNPSYSLSVPLILPSDFEYFNLAYPDSLKWVLPLMNE